MTATAIETGNLEIKAEVSIDDTGTVTGIAWPFGQPDSYGDLIEPTAFSFAGRVPMIVEHEQKSVVGVWETYAVTDKGLEVKGRLFVEGIEPARQARLALQRGTMRGLSIGYRLHEAKARPEGGRVLTALTINEISLCKRPVHPDARITETKSHPINVEQENTEMENAEQKKPEAVADPVVSAEEIKALKHEIATMQAKLNRRPSSANNNHPKAVNDNGNEVKAFETEVRQALLEKKALTVAAPGTADNLVWDEFSTTILEKLRPVSPVRQLATVVTVGSALFQIPRLVNRVQPGSVTEVQAKPSSEPSFEQIDIKNFAMGVMTPVSRTALEDNAVNLGSYLQNHISSEFSTLENEWFVTGDGTTQAEGILTSTDVESIPAGSLISADSLLDVLYGVKSAYALNGSWLMNRRTMRAVRGLRDSDGNLLWQSGLQAGQPGLLLGKPVYECDFMPDASADETPIIFGDFNRGYLITDRITFEPFADYNTRFGEDIVVFGGRRRVGGKVVMGEALIKLKIAA